MMRRRTSEEWKVLFEEQESSGLSQAEFCKVRGISHGTFHWRKKKQKADLRRGGDFIELPTTAVSAAGIGSINSKGKVELELPGGAVLRLSW
jgi:hypothetical protein